MSDSEQPSFQIQLQEPHTLIITLSGRLDMKTVPILWQSCIDAQEKHHPAQLILEAEKVTYCDGAGVALFRALQKRQEDAKATFQINHLDPQFQQLMQAVQHKATAQQMNEHEPLPFRVGVGLITVDMVRDIKNNVAYLGALSYQLFHSLRHPKWIRWKDMWVAVENVGPKAFPIVALIGFLIGLITTFQSARPLGEFGAQIYIINLVGLGLVREMGPLMTAVLLAGRTASSFAAELGTMKINQEIDALTTMGLNPIRFLTVPRILATTMMTPFLNLFLILFGLLGCGVVMFYLGYPVQTFFKQLKVAINFSDFMTGFIKAIVFGFVIAGIGCFDGLKTKSNSSAVGLSTTKAVVDSLIMIVIVDGIFAVIYYVLGV
ncbi:MAG: MlaE family lipid ABC transporter permease subunit [Gammaproteobacteria bacterium]|nr:MlaE family lipid ABC transporter permease subunit [Gammaproteobacteria bacterium]MBU1926753.1 MlaE family lipid ABC transporter permease subunit [Gammaproteobacteria bacterium]MBU2546269.1 MlaE family lipid ABC transporter permease subunit [Gammaproteobacteria bacterium]